MKSLFENTSELKAQIEKHNPFLGNLTNIIYQFAIDPVTASYQPVWSHYYDAFKKWLQEYAEEIEYLDAFPPGITKRSLFI